MSNVFTYITETLIAAWFVALLIGVGNYWFDRNKSLLEWKYRAILCISVGVVSGAGLSIIGAVQRGADRGLVPNDLKWFVIAMTLLLIAAAALPPFLFRRSPVTKHQSTQIEG